MANGFVDLKKECLQSSAILVKYSIEKKHQSFVTLTWEVHDYSYLEKSVIYSKEIKSETFKWVFRLVKAEGTLFLFLWSNDVPNTFVTFSLITSDHNATSPSIRCKEICEGLYVSEFCSRAIQNPNNKLLVNNVLKARFSYRTRMPVEKMTLPYGQPDVKLEGHDLCEDFKALYLSSICTDFILVSKDGKPFYVHKLVLRARSELFKEFFDKDDAKNRIRNKLKIDACSLTLECIVMYMYCGELRDIHIEIMMDVFTFAAILKIPSLVKVCVKYLKENMTLEIRSLKDSTSKKKHVSGVYGIAVMHKVVEMKNECIRYLNFGDNPKRFPELFKEVKKLEKEYDEIRTKSESY